jgi:hypothetical protein
LAKSMGRSTQAAMDAWNLLSIGRSCIMEPK